jgi:RND family efflux transporter MFP subunit
MWRYPKGLVCLAGCLGFGALLTGCDGKPVQGNQAAAKKDLPVVKVILPITDVVSEFEDFTGQTMALYSVDIRARVTGYLDKVLFEDGTEVEKGTPLFEIDARPYKADYDRTEATVVQNEAHLKRLDADYHRVANLYARGNASREEFDRVVGDRAEAEAAVGIAKANRDLAKLNLEYTKVYAPISGRLSRRQVDPGNLVKADDTILTSIVSLDPMFVYFDVDEQTVLRLRRLVREGKIRSRAEAEIPVMAALSDEEDYPHRGTINFSDNKVDPNTGTLRVRGIVENPMQSRTFVRVLSPGMYMKVRLPVGTPHQALLVPEQSVGADQGRKFVYVVDDKNVVVERDVEVGVLSGQFRVIQSGLKPNERVVYRGLQRIRPRMKVRPELEEVKKQPAEATPVARPDQGPSPAPPAVIKTGREAAPPPSTGAPPKG